MDEFNDAKDPFRTTSLVPYVDADNASPAVRDELKVLPFRRNIFLLLGHSPGLFPPHMGVIGGCFDSNVRSLPLLDWQLIVLRTATTLGAQFEYDVQHSCRQSLWDETSENRRDRRHNDARRSGGWKGSLDGTRPYHPTYSGRTTRYV